MDEYIAEHGNVSTVEVIEIVEKLNKQYFNEEMEIIHYSYEQNAECILIYGDGKVILDPYPNVPNFQLEIGNIFNDKPELILQRFFKDKDNFEGYNKHLQKK